MLVHILFIVIPKILLNITGCPGMNGPTNDNYIFMEYNTDYYEIISNNGISWESCDADIK